MAERDKTTPAEPLIRSATKKDLARRALTTAYIDLGFGGSSTKSSAIRIVRKPFKFDSIAEPPQTLTIGKLRQTLREIYTGHHPGIGRSRDVLLVLEGPLSRRFDADCPVARGVDLNYGPSYGWHLQSSQAARQAARVVIEDALEARRRAKLCVNIILAEGFVSGKPGAATKASAAFRAATAAVDNLIPSSARGSTSDPHQLDTEILQLIHAGEVGRIFHADEPELRGCDSILGRISGVHSEPPPPVLSVAPSAS